MTDIIRSGKRWGCYEAAHKAEISALRAQISEAAETIRSLREALEKIAKNEIEVRDEDDSTVIGAMDADELSDLAREALERFKSPALPADGGE